MRAIRVHISGEDRRLQMEDVPRPEPGPGDVVARVRCTGICGSDLLNYSRNTPPETLPAGHEVAGEIAEVGEGVDPGLVGRRVVVRRGGPGAKGQAGRFAGTGGLPARRRAAARGPRPHHRVDGTR